VDRALRWPSVRQGAPKVTAARHEAIKTHGSGEPAEPQAPIAGVRSLDGQGRSDEDIARLKARTADFGESGKVLARAREISRGDAFDAHRATETWQRVETRFHIELDGEFRGEYRSVNGHTFSVGDVSQLPGGTCRVLAVDMSEDRRVTARLIVEGTERSGI
jgi:hypothetical protein